MSPKKRGQYTLEYKQEALRLKKAGQSLAVASKTLGVSSKTLHSWVKLQTQGKLVCQIKSWLGHKCTIEKRFYISSLAPDSAHIAQAIRSHWAIESVPQAHAERKFIMMS
jgi:transposase